MKRLAGLLVLVVFAAAAFAACGGDSNDEQIAQLQTELSNTKTQLTGLQALVGQIRLGLHTPSYVPGENPAIEGFEDKGTGLAYRQFNAFDTHIALIRLAEQFLDRGDTQTAKYLTEVAIGFLGIEGCVASGVLMTNDTLPESLLQLVEADLAPLYTFERSASGLDVTVHWSQPIIGCPKS